MKKLALFLVVVLLACLCLSGCNKHDSMIEEAILELENYWTEIYDRAPKQNFERYFEIKNTRVITLQENDSLPDVEYIIEFTLFTAYYGDEIYVDSGANGDSTVAVYQDGTMKVVSNSILIEKHAYLSYLDREYDIIKSVDDYGNKYNCVKTLD